MHDSIDSISVVFYFRQNLTWELFEKSFLEKIFTFDKRFAPEFVSYKDRWQALNPDIIDRLNKEWTQTFNLSFERRSPFRSAFVFSKGRVANGFNVFSFWLSQEYFIDTNDTNRFLDFCIAIYEVLSPSYGYIHPTQDIIAMRTYEDPKYGKTIRPVNLKLGLPDIYWGNFFGKSYVSQIGKSHLYQTDCFKITEMSDGGVLFLTTQSPLIPDHDIQLHIMKEIGYEYFSHAAPTVDRFS